MNCTNCERALSHDDIDNGYCLNCEETISDPREDQDDYRDHEYYPLTDEFGDNYYLY
jgi:hypothetical protein